MSTRAEILAQITSLLPDNNTRAISPTDLRTVVNSLTTSCTNLDDDGTPTEILASAAATAAAQVAAHNESAGAHAWEAFQRLRGRLDSATSHTATLKIVTDSTGVGSGNWPAKLAEAIAATSPSFNVRTRKYTSSVDGGDDTWGAATDIYTAVGGPSRIDYSGATGANMPRWPATGAFGTNGWFVDCRAKFATGALSGAKPANPLFVRGIASFSTWTLGLFTEATTGQLVLKYNSADTGIPDQTLYFGVLGAATFEGVETVFRLKYTGGTAKKFQVFYSQNGGASFTQFGTDQTVTTVPSSTSNREWFLGTLASSYFHGSIYGLEVWQYTTADSSGAAQLVLPSSIGNWRPYYDATNAVTGWTYAGAPTLDINIGACGGYHLNNFICTSGDAGGVVPLAYWTNPFTDVVLYGALHNYNLLTGTAAIVQCETYIAAFETYAKTVNPAAAFVMFTELPLGDAKTIQYRSSSEWKQWHGAAYAKRLGTPVIDTLAAVKKQFPQSQITSETASGSGIHYDAGSPIVLWVADLFAEALH